MSGAALSSDGQRFRAGGHGEAAARVNLKQGTDPSARVYTHLSDRYAPFHSRAVKANVRDATHVLDGLLLPGFRFAPRIRDLKDKRLHIPGKADGYPALDGLFGDTINQAHLSDHWDEVLRLATSIRQGSVTASLMLKKLGSYPRQNGLALALREVGRIERTLFMLEWMQDPELRRRVQIGLNKGEARNALARAVFFNRQGEMRARSFENRTTGQVEDVWGISSRWGEKLRALGMEDAGALRQASPNWLRQRFGVVMERIGWELRGAACPACRWKPCRLHASKS